MNSNEQTIATFIKRLGFSADEAQLYLLLLEHGSQTVLSLSRISQIERTKLYRIISQLILRGLIEEQVVYKTRKYKAVDPASLERLIAEQEQNVHRLKSEYVIFNQTAQAYQKAMPPHKILYYQGVEGMKQMMWNALQTKTELLSYVHTVFNPTVSDFFFSGWAEEVISRSMHLREIRTGIFLWDSCKHWYMGSHYEWRYKPKAFKDFTHSMDIYNDVVSIYYWRDKMVYGVEIYNNEIANMQRNIFEILWKQSTRRTREETRAYKELERLYNQK